VQNDDWRFLSTKKRGGGKEKKGIQRESRKKEKVMGGKNETRVWRKVKWGKNQNPNRVQVKLDQKKKKKI